MRRLQLSAHQEQGGARRTRTTTQSLAPVLPDLAQVLAGPGIARQLVAVGQPQRQPRLAVRVDHAQATGLVQEASTEVPQIQGWATFVLIMTAVEAVWTPDRLVM
mmetsp:Transcript_4629/g.11213  ORF Transcript_4629/g.11213 Transcript_4629/m.11213 type:complete len:105 (+) Transcript_4629:2690-3004(+)